MIVFIQVDKLIVCFDYINVSVWDISGFVDYNTPSDWKLLCLWKFGRFTNNSLTWARKYIYFLNGLEFCQTLIGANLAATYMINQLISPQGEVLHQSPAWGSLGHEVKLWL